MANYSFSFVVVFRRLPFILILFIGRCSLSLTVNSRLYFIDHLNTWKISKRAVCQSINRKWYGHRIFFWWSRVNDLTWFWGVFLLQIRASPWLLVLCQDSTQPFPSRAMGRIHLLSRCVNMCKCVCQSFFCVFFCICFGLGECQSVSRCLCVCLHVCIPLQQPPVFLLPLFDDNINNIGN